MTGAKKLKSRGNLFTPFTGCAQIYHQRWYVRPSGTPAESIVCLATANRGRYTSPAVQRTHLPICVLCVQTKAKVRLLSAHKVYECIPLPRWQNVGASYG